MLGLSSLVLFTGFNGKGSNSTCIIEENFNPATQIANGNRGKLIWACSGRPLPGVENDLRANGVGASFHFGGARIYMAPDDPGVHDGTYGDWNDDRKLSPLIQGASGYVSIPMVSMTCNKYPQVWNGENDAKWKSQLDSFEKYWGSIEKPVKGPWGIGAYPIMMSFQHEWTDNRAAGKAFDPLCVQLSQPQQYAKSMRYLIDLQRSYKPGLNVKWTWIPMAYSFWNHNGVGKAPVTEWWPSRIAGDSSEPDFTNTDYIDVVGCDGYMSDADFKNIFDKDGDNSTRSVVGFARSVGKINPDTGKSNGLPWMIGEWGIDEKFGSPDWKKNTLNDMMLQIRTNYTDLVYMSIWPNSTKINDNRWNSGPKLDDTPTGYGTPNSQGISGQAFVSICAAVLPDGRPDIFRLLI